MAHTCGGNCANCGGCAKELVLTQREIDLLETLSQIPFLPVARKADTMDGVYLDEPAEDKWTPVLACLEKKGLIDLDYRAPLSGFDYSSYKGYPVHGAMALTARGQSVIELIQLQGLQEE